MYTALHVGRLAVHVGGQSLRVNGKAAPIYDMRDFVQLYGYRFEFIGAVRGRDGLLTRDGRFAPTNVESSVLGHEILGSNLGARVTVRSSTTPTPGVVVSCLDTFSWLEMSVSDWITSVDGMPEKEGVMPLPRWFVEDPRGDEWHSILGGTVRLVEVRHLPFCLQPWESLVNKDDDQALALHLYRGACRMWAIEHNVHRLWLAYDEPSEVYSCPFDKGDPMKVISGPAKRQVMAILNGSRYEPPANVVRTMSKKSDSSLFTGPVTKKEPDKDSSEVELVDDMVGESGNEVLVKTTSRPLRTEDFGSMAAAFAGLDPELFGMPTVEKGEGA